MKFFKLALAVFDSKCVHTFELAAIGPVFDSLAILEVVLPLTLVQGTI